MRFLITGSSGFIGGYLSRELTNAGHTVTGMDMKEGPGQDASDPISIRNMLQSSRADVVVHLAARGPNLFGEEDVMQTVRDNVGMTAVVAQAAGELKARMVYASTDDVYGDNGTAVCDELDGPWSLPGNIHALSKLCAEQTCKLYAPEGFTALRFSMPYGPGLLAGRGRSAIINMLWQAKNGMPIPVHIGAERSWCWIGDAVRAARIAIEKGEGPYNIGRDDDPTSMERVAQLACIIAGGDPGLVEMIQAPARQTVVKRLSAARVRRLGWSPQVGLYDGMEETFRTWVERLDANGAYVEPTPEPKKKKAAAR